VEASEACREEGKTLSKILKVEIHATFSNENLLDLAPHQIAENVDQVRAQPSKQALWKERLGVFTFRAERWSHLTRWMNVSKVGATYWRFCSSRGQR